MTDKFKAAIYEYEAARQEVAKYSDQRNRLVSSCALEMEYPFNDKRARQVCLKIVFAECREMNNQPYETYEYGEVLDDMHAEGECCDNCYQSYQIKKGPLADAKQRFGNAKRRLAAMGKTLIGSLENA